MGAISFLVVSSIRIHFYSSNVNLRIWRVLHFYWTLLNRVWTDTALFWFLIWSEYSLLLSAPRAPSPPIRTHRSRQGKKEKVLQSCHEKRADLKDSYLSIKSALWIFSDTFSPLTGAVAFWYNPYSTNNSILRPSFVDKLHSKWFVAQKCGYWLLSHAVDP